jgi:hypothetical protein
MMVNMKDSVENIFIDAIIKYTLWNNQAFTVRHLLVLYLDNADTSKSSGESIEKETSNPGDF